MSSPSPERPRFVIVPHRPHVRLLLGVAAALWLASMALAWTFAAQRAAPGLASLREEHAAQGERLAALEATLDDQRQQLATLRRSDEISRAANLELQDTIAQRDEEIAGLRADVAFYERLVGSSAQRRGLNVHNLALAEDADGGWRYQVTLTQNLNRGGSTRGGLTLRVEGTRGGRLETLAWADLRAGADDAPQAFGFRYFQSLEGSIVLPAGFTPQRVVVTLRTGANTVEQAWPWEDVVPAGIEAVLLDDGAAPGGDDDIQGDDARETEE